MSETLGSLCDKLTIVKLKQWHSEDKAQLINLDVQEQQLKDEIDEFIRESISGKIPVNRLSFPANKVYQQEKNRVYNVEGSIGQVFSQLAEVNCQLWHEQEKVYEFDQVPISEKDYVVKQLALLNLQRNKCIDRIDRNFRELIEGLQN